MNSLTRMNCLNMTLPVYCECKVSKQRDDYCTTVATEKMSVFIAGLDFPTLYMMHMYFTRFGLRAVKFQFS